MSFRRRVLGLLGVPKTENLPTTHEVADELRYVLRQLKGPMGKFWLAAALIGTWGMFSSPGSRFASTIQDIYEMSPLIAIVVLVLCLIGATLLVAVIAVAVVAPMGGWILKNILGYTVIPREKKEGRGE